MPRYDRKHIDLFVNSDNDLLIISYNFDFKNPALARTISDYTIP